MTEGSPHPKSLRDFDLPLQGRCLEFAFDAIHDRAFHI
jgi:hypothetical protein